MSYSGVKLCYHLHRYACMCKSIFGGAFLLQIQIPLSPGMVSNDDTSQRDRSVVGEEILCSDFAIMYVSHIADLFVFVCVINHGYSLLLSVLKEFHKIKCGITA